MLEQDFTQFQNLMAGLAENYGQTLTAQGIALRFKALAKFELIDVQKAAMSILENRKYSGMPTVADFLEHLSGGGIEDKAEVEAGKVLEAIARIGGNDSIVFDDPTTAAVIQNAYGGWPKLCEGCGVEESEKWFRHNFAKTWAAYKRQGVQVFGMLPGRHEITNAANGYLRHIPKPRLIGDQERARKVLEMGPQGTPRQLRQGAVSFGAAHRLIPDEETRGIAQ